MGAEISYRAEIESYLDGRTPELVESELYETWQKLDSNGSGSLDVNESRDFFKLLFEILQERGVAINEPEKVMDEWMKHLDKDGDNEVSWREFQTALRALMVTEDEDQDLNESLQREKAAPVIRSQISFGSGDVGKPFDHFAENPQISKIRKIRIWGKKSLKSFQVIYELTNKKTWVTPIWSGSK